MKLIKIEISNCRSIESAVLRLDNYTLLVGENNAGKSNLVNAIRLLLGGLKISEIDTSSWTSDNCESFVDGYFKVGDTTKSSIGEEYFSVDNVCIMRRIIKTKNSSLKEGRIYMLKEGLKPKEYKGGDLPEVIYVPAFSNASEQLRLTGPSALRGLVTLAFEDSEEYQAEFNVLGSAIDTINDKLRTDGGILKEIKDNLNSKLANWGVEAQFSARQIDASDIIKSIIDVSFIDLSDPSKEKTLDSFGHGFQRSVVYNLINLSSEIKTRDKSSEKPNSILLFEEPEAYLHPNQQVNLAKTLKDLSQDSFFQVVLTTHSPSFIQKSTDDLTSIARLSKVDGRSSVFQIDVDDLKLLLSQQSEIARAIEKREVAEEQYTDNFSYHIWLDAERSSLFFANKVLIVEGATERVLINYLLENEWEDFDSNKLYILDSLGKYNIPRYMKMLELFGIPHGAIYDDDANHTSVKKIQENAELKNIIQANINEFTLNSPVAIPNCTELFLGVDEPSVGYQKPLRILVAISNGRIAEDNLLKFRSLVELALGQATSY